MTADIDFDRRLERWFLDEAPERAPDRVLSASMDVVSRIPQRRGVGVRIGRRWHALEPRRRVLLIAASLVLLLGATVAVGAFVLGLLDSDSPVSVVLVRGDDGSDQPTSIVVVERAVDGRETTLARFTADQLGGTPQLWLGTPVVSDFDHVAVPIARPDGTYGYAVADLRDPSAAAMSVDVTGDFADFGPDGTLGMSTPDGLAMFDPFTGRSESTHLTSAVGTPSTPPTALDRLVSWATDGSGVLADRGLFVSAPDGSTKASAIGTLRRDGTFVEGTVPLRYDGVRARRASADGALLRCDGGYDDCGLIEWDLYAVTSAEQHVIWDNPDTTHMISDFAWTVDGGLWLLLETAAPGPRTVTLLRVDPDGTESVIGRFDAPADDPDPSSYFQSSTFAGLAPDDSRLGVRIAGENGSMGTTWLVDPATGDRQRVPGMVAGWRDGGAAPADRPDVEPMVPTDPVLRGLWADTELAVRFGASSVVVDAVRAPASGTVERIGSNEIAISGTPGSLGCDAGLVGRYQWSIVDGRLTLDAIDEPCGARQSALERTFDQALPMDSNGPPHVGGGRTLRAAAFAPTFVVTLPTSDVEAEVQAYGPAEVALTLSAGDSFVAVRIKAPTKGAQRPCERFSSASRLPESGMAGVFAYLATAGVERRGVTAVTIDGRPGERFTVVSPAACQNRLTLFAGNDGRATFTDPAATITAFELDDGTPIIIESSAPANDAAAAAWIQAVIDSIDFGSR
jgi:hypothetical protein